MANRLIEAIKGIGPVKFDFTHRESSENLYTSLFEVIDHSKDTLIVIDELTLFLNILDREEGRRESEFFLNWFRSLRQVTNSKIRWIFCGSVGLHNFTRSRSLSMTINDMVSFDFDALSNAEANGLVEALSEGEKIPIDQEIRNFILNKIEWYVPYFIQLLFTNIKDYPNSRKGITKEIVDDAYERLVRSDDLGTWGERLTEYNGQEPGAKIILKELSKSAEGLSRDQLFAIFSLNTGLSSYDADNQLSLILNMLEHDGYIMRAKGGIRCFRSSLLKQWWYYKFVE
ncbi:MAG: hypothetical protein LUD17_01880 [Bacteroidales bacterium]|nr:hypothetical protein [Bacteroidales bacterium]